MSHLTEHQILECVAGEARPECIDHIQSCSDCASRVRTLSAPLRLFADSVREIAPVRPTFRLSQPRWQFGYWPALVAAALFLLIRAPFYRGRQVPITRREPVVSDEVLLQRVQVAVGKSVPSPMAPLAVSFTGDSGNQE